MTWYRSSQFDSTLLLISATKKIYRSGTTWLRNPKVINFLDKGDCETLINEVHFWSSKLRKLLGYMMTPRIKRADLTNDSCRECRLFLHVTNRHESERETIVQRRYMYAPAIASWSFNRERDRFPPLFENRFLRIARSSRKLISGTYAGAFPAWLWRLVRRLTSFTSFAWNFLTLEVNFKHFLASSAEILQPGILKFTSSQFHVILPKNFEITLKYFKVLTINLYDFV